jgi:hypothetical protein
MQNPFGRSAEHDDSVYEDETIEIKESADMIARAERPMSVRSNGSSLTLVGAIAVAKNMPCSKTFQLSNECEAIGRKKCGVSSRIHFLRDGKSAELSHCSNV